MPRLLSAVRIGIIEHPPSSRLGLRTFEHAMIRRPKTRLSVVLTFGPLRQPVRTQWSTKASYEARATRYGMFQIYPFVDTYARRSSRVGLEADSRAVEAIGSYRNKPMQL